MAKITVADAIRTFAVLSRAPGATPGPLAAIRLARLRLALLPEVRAFEVARDAVLVPAGLKHVNPTSEQAAQMQPLLAPLLLMEFEYSGPMTEETDWTVFPDLTQEEAAFLLPFIR